MTGLVQVEEERIYPIPEAVRSSRNQYMDRMAGIGYRRGKRKTGVYSGPELLYRSRCCEGDRMMELVIVRDEATVSVEKIDQGG